MKLYLALFIIPALAFGAFQPIDSIASMPDTSWLLLSKEWPEGLTSLTDYSGMVYNPHRHTIMLHGGGHAATGATNVLEFDFATLKWDTLTPSAPCSHYDSAHCVFYNDTVRTGGIYDANGNPVPVSRHSYDGVVIPHDTDLMIVAIEPWSQGSGGNSCTGSGTGYGLTNNWTGNAMWILDRATLRWSYTWAKWASWYGLPGQSMTVRPGGQTAYNPNDGMIYGLEGSLTVHDYKNQTVRVLGPGYNSQLDRALNYYEPNNSLLFFGNNSVYEWPLDDSGWVDKNPAGTYLDPYYRQVCYDSVNNVFFFIKDTAFHYYSYQTNTWYHIPYSTQYPGNAANKNVIYDPVNNVAIVVTVPTPPPWSLRYTWAYKFSNTPGRFPGTSSQSAVANAQAGNAGLSINVVPNPINGMARISISSRFKVQGSKFKVQILTINGKVVKDLTPRIPNSSFVIRNSFTFCLQAKGLSPGVYLIRAFTGKNIYCKKVVIIQ